MKKVDLNVDIGEGFDWDEELMQFATSVNICLGYHAGSPELTDQTLSRASQLGLRIGAHPGFPDREGFGRRYWAETGIKGPVTRAVIRQLGKNADLVSYIKPHGAFYNESSEHGGLVANALVSTLVRYRKPLMGLDGSFHVVIAESVGVPLIREGFVDRRYSIDSLLLPRKDPNSTIESIDEKVEQAVRLAETVDSLCIHGDSETSVQTIIEVRKALESAGYEVGY